MKERPILFNGPMVRAILEGRKTQTRRVRKTWALEKDCPYGIPGHRLWVREKCIITPKSWNDGVNANVWDAEGDFRTVQYLATNPDKDAANDYNLKVTPSIFMPHWASRITLEITDVRVQRLQEISEEDARAEGVDTSVVDPSPRGVAPIYPKQYAYARDCFRDLWDSINGKKHPWESNPWVWALTFRRPQ